MRLTLAYGTDGLEVDVPDDAVVVGPQEPPALADEAGALRRGAGRPDRRPGARPT